MSTNNATVATSTQKETTASPTPAVKKEVQKPAPPVDNSAIIKAQVEAQIKAKADQDALVAKQKADEQARLDAVKAEADRQAAQNTANIAAQQAMEQQAIRDAAQAKQQKLNAVNQKIADLNAKYAKDMKNCNSGGGTVAGANACKNAKTNTYTDDYNTLVAEFQQIEYGN